MEGNVHDHKGKVLGQKRKARESWGNVAGEVFIHVGAQRVHHLYKPVLRLPMLGCQGLLTIIKAAQHSHYHWDR